MGRKVMLWGGIFFFLVCGATTALRAQEPEQQDAEEVDVMYTFGTVARVSPGEIVLWEYDYDKDEEAAVSYTVVPETELNGMTSVEELQEGDAVEIYYIEEGGVRIAGFIQRDESYAFDEEMTGIEQEPVPLETVIGDEDE